MAEVPLLIDAKEDAEAFAAVYDAYGERVLKFLMRRVSDVDLAHDMNQEVFAVAFERRAQFRGTTVEEEQGWLFSIARSQVSAYLRRGAVERAALTRLAGEPQDLDDNAIRRFEDLAAIDAIKPAIDAALDALPADQRDAISLRVLQERSYEDIAAELGVSSDVARSRVSRGLRTVAKALIAIIILAAAVAGAAQLVKSGKPRLGLGTNMKQYRPGKAPPVIDVVVPDPGGGLPWGVEVFRSRDDSNCMLSGQVRGGVLGLVRHGGFRPYDMTRTGGICLHSYLKRTKGEQSGAEMSKSPPRFVVIGHEPKPVSTVRLQLGRYHATTRVGPHGAFIFAVDFRGDQRAQLHYRLQYFDAAGHRLVGGVPHRLYGG